MVLAPPGDRFPSYPLSWYLFGPARGLLKGPVSRDMLGRRLVAFRTASGRVAVLEARCAHLGADLGRGRVAGEAIQCPFHHWEYGPDGRCTHIPAGGPIPGDACQAAFPVVERHGLVFFFNAPQPRFPLPFFPDADPDDFVAARPFGAVLRCPWYMIGANAFDMQHFRAAHDRRFMGAPEVCCPAPFARRAACRFRVAGTSIRDRVTRWFAGDEVVMASTDWCGNLIFTTAAFRRTCSYGMIATEPLAPAGVRVRVIVFLPRSRGRLGRALLDPLRLAIRRFFIKQFLSADAGLLDGACYNPHGLIDADQDMAEYFQWLAEVAHGTPYRQETNGRACDLVSGGRQ